MANIKEIQLNKPIKELLDFCVINVNKPPRMTSFEVVERIINITGAKKAGHFGTLDPNVTGVLPIAINRACKLSNYFMRKDKEYIGKMILHKDISEQELNDEMKKFIGKIKQTPPLRSNVKIMERERLVNKFKIINKEGRIVLFSSNVQAGTYIRKLVHDLGKGIGGAHMIELKRIKASIFNEKESFPIEEIAMAFREYKKGDDKKLRDILIPAEIIQRIITSIQVKDVAVHELLNGKPIMKKDIDGKIPNSELFSVFAGERFIGIYKFNKENKDSEDIIAKPEFVLN
jgi:H/ACA ribonucleoprotein complex subunit 4